MQDVDLPTKPTVQKPAINRTSTTPVHETSTARSPRGDTSAPMVRDQSELAIRHHVDLLPC